MNPHLNASKEAMNCLPGLLKPLRNESRNSVISLRESHVNEQLQCTHKVCESIAEALFSDEIDLSDDPIELHCNKIYDQDINVSPEDIVNVNVNNTKESH